MKGWREEIHMDLGGAKTKVEDSIKMAKKIIERLRQQNTKTEIPSWFQ